MFAPELARARTRTLLHPARTRIPAAPGVLAACLLAACGSSAEPTPDARVPDGGVVPDASGGCSGSLASRGEIVHVRPGLDFAAGELFEPAVAVNEQAVAVVAWAERVGTVDRVLATRFENGCWEAPVELAASQGVGADAVIDADGRATVVWTHRELDGSQGIAATTLWAARYEDGAWQAPQRISAEPALNATWHTLEPQVTLDDAGGVVVVWIQRTSKGDTVAWNRFEPDAGPDTGWGTPGAIASSVILGAEPQVASAGPGQLVAVWRQRAEPLPFEAVTNVFTSRWTGTGWSAAEPIGDPSLAGSDHAEALELVSLGSAGAGALWLQQKGAKRVYRQNVFDAASQTWAGATIVTPLDNVAMGEGRVTAIDVAGSDTGAMTLVGLAMDASQASDLIAARFETGAGWGPIALLSGLNGARPLVGMDGRGNAVSAGFASSVGMSFLWLVRTYAPGSWGEPQEIEIAGGGPSLAVGRAGHVLLAFTTHEMVGESWHNFITAILYSPSP